jgi:hypothetical protein
VLALGIVARYFPWSYSPFFKADLVRIRPESVLRVQVVEAGQTDIALERTDKGWLASGHFQPVIIPDSAVQRILDGLCHLQSEKLWKTPTGNTPEKTWQVTLFTDRGQETIQVGPCRVENGAPITIIGMPLHGEAYAVSGHKCTLFDLDYTALRRKARALLLPDSLQTIALIPSDGHALRFYRADTAATWLGADTALNWPATAVAQWAARLNRLIRDRPFADYFDESRAAEYPTLVLILKTTRRAAGVAEPGAVTLRFFLHNGANLPENTEQLSTTFSQRLHYVLHDSRDPYNYFTITDTAAVHALFRPTMSPR